MTGLFKIEGHSMEPAIKAGQYFLVLNFTGPKVNDIIIVKHQKKSIFLVKRVKAVLKEGKYLVEGDNPGHSEDSRKFGAIKEEQIVGKLSFCFWPLQKFGF